MHFPSEDFVHVGLVAFSARAEPSEDVGVNTEADQLFDGAVELADVDFLAERKFFGGIGVVDLMGRACGEDVEVAALFLSQRRREEGARGDSLFVPS